MVKLENSQLSIFEFADQPVSIFDEDYEHPKM